LHKNKNFIRQLKLTAKDIIAIIKNCYDFLEFLQINILKSLKYSFKALSFAVTFM